MVEWTWQHEGAMIDSMAACVDQWNPLQLEDTARKPGLRIKGMEYPRGGNGRCKMKFKL